VAVTSREAPSQRGNVSDATLRKPDVPAPSRRVTLEKHCPVPRRLADVYGQVIFVTLLFFLTFLSRFIFSPLMPAISADIGLSTAGAGMIFFLGSVGSLAGALLSGWLSSKIDHRGNLILATLVTGISLGVCFVARAPWVLEAVIIVLGFCAGLNQPSVTATVAAMVSRQDWGKALSVQQTGPRLSYGVAPFLAVGLLSFLSWQAALAVIGAFTVACSLAFVAWGDCGGFKGTPPNPRLLAVVLRERGFWLMVLLFSLGIGAQAGLYSMMPLYLTLEQGYARGTANTIVGLAAIAPILTTFFAGWLTDRIGEKRAVISFMLVSGAAAIAVGESERAGRHRRGLRALGSLGLLLPTGLRRPLPHRPAQLPQPDRWFGTSYRVPLGRRGASHRLGLHGGGLHHRPGHHHHWNRSDGRLLRRAGRETAGQPGRGVLTNERAGSGELSRRYPSWYHATTGVMLRVPGSGTTNVSSGLSHPSVRATSGMHRPSAILWPSSTSRTGPRSIHP
jgi:predicted MFS family arabinose efflux permease